jgi:phosphatidylglycerophosphate synthase
VPETLDDPAAASTSSVVLIRSDYVFEERTLADLIRQPGVVVTASTHNGSHAPIVAAHVAAADAAAARAVLEEAADARAIAGVVARSPESLSTSFVRKLHKAVPPVVLAARPERAAALEKHLFDGSYKGVTDLVTKWLWPGPARAVVGFCARNGISPNMVTSVSFALVVGATLCFAYGWFGTGLLCAWIMTFLDTVDGKLARVTVTSTRFGHYFDHSIDTVHPPIWYFAWAWGVAGGPPWDYAPLLVAILVFYVAGRLIEAFFKRFIGSTSMFAWRPFDSYFRLILARRNPNLILLMTAYLVGNPGAGVTWVAVWTVVSTIVLLVRLVQGAIARGRGKKLRPWLEELGSDPGALPGWARPFVADLAAVRHLVQ